MRLKIALGMLAFALLACSFPGTEAVEDLASDVISDEASDGASAETDAGAEAESPADPAAPADGAAGEEGADPAAEPTSEPAPADTGESYPGASNNCSHPYYPVVEGATWTYDSALQGEPPETYIVTLSNVTEDTFEFNQQFEEGEFNIVWECRDDGLVQTTYATASVGNQALEFELETTSFDGLTFPENFEPGTTWSTSYQTVTNVAEMDMDLSIDIQITYTYVTDEEITVPAGTFNAARVEQTITLTSSMAGMDQSVEAVSWFVEGIGLVRNESEFAGFASYYELADYSFPQ